ncbi:MAG: hypothetical protein H0U74_21935 [Bradymonadaceae bacterium]|nr:hypothetical protein [Lujinxingiaceae bacterium]
MSDSKSDPEIKSNSEYIFSGMDRTEMQIDSVTTLCFVLFSGALIWIYGHMNDGLLLAGVVLVALSFGARYKLRIALDGVTLYRWRFWIFARKRVAFLLDARIEHQWPLESDKPEGLVIADYEDSERDACFESGASPALDLLLDSINRALTQVRKTVTDHQETRHELIWTDQAFDLSTSVWAGTRIREIHSIAESCPGGIAIPPASKFEFNAALNDPTTAWMDPRRPDILHKVEISAPLELPGLGTLAIGSTLFFHHGMLHTIKDSAHNLRHP